MKRMAAMTLAAALILGGSAAIVRGDEGQKDGARRNRSSRQGRAGRLADDVRVRLSLGWRKDGSSRAKIQVKNQGRNRQDGVLVRLLADSEAGIELWTATADLAPGATRAFKVPIVPDAGTAALVATAALDGVEDQDPADNAATVSLGAVGGGSGGGGDDGGGGGGGGGGIPSVASIGAGIYAANCASCHGADARGAGEAPSILAEPAEEIAEAIREGEEGMPTFPGLTAADVRALAAFLRDPGAATPPPPPAPAPPPPAGTAPTYAGQVKALLDANCVGCHGGTNPSGNVRLHTYAQAKANAAAALAAVQAGRMPKGGTPLAADQVRLLQDWIAGGTKP